MIVLSALSLVFCFCVILWLVQHWWRNRKFYELIMKIPSIEGHVSFLGHAFDFVGADNKKIFELISTATAPKPESPRKFWEGPIIYVVIDDPEQIKKVLNSKYFIDKPRSVYANFKVSDGIFVVNGDTWRRQRKLLDPAFSPTVFKSFLPIFNEKAQTLLRVLDDKADGLQFNIHKFFAPLALDNILSSSLGLNENVQTEKSHEYVTHCTEAMKVYAMKISKVWFKITPLYKCTETYKMEEKHVTNGMYMIGNEIVERKEQNHMGLPEATSDPKNKPQIFIDQIYKMRSHFSLKEIRDNVTIYIFAGFETISNTLSMTVLLLAMHPHVQDKVFDELQLLFDADDDEISDDKLERLVYLEMVLKEAMRLWPSIPFIARSLTEDVELGSCVVPAGSNICFPVYHIHRSKKIWGSDAEEFRPERFEPEEFEKIPPSAYLPFSRGPRICPGVKYAMNSMKVTLAYLLRNYKASTTLKLEEIEFEFSVLLKVANGCMVSLERRAKK